MLHCANRDGLIDLGASYKLLMTPLIVWSNSQKEIPDTQRMPYLAFHSKPPSAVLHSYQVTKKKTTWIASFQHRWLENFTWLSYSNALGGGMCAVVVFSSLAEPPERGGTKRGRPGVLVLSPYQKSYTKALGKDGILVWHEETVMHRHAAEQADLFKTEPDQI